MSNNNTLAVVDGDTLLKLVGGGDTSSLSGEQKLAYYRARCDAAGLDSRTAPFQFMKLQGKETLYATKGATDQLASLHGIRVEIQSQETALGVRTVHVRAIAKDGRQTDDIGVVAVDGLKGSDLCNAYMKAVTKAKRRAILSLCGLGMIDETELETVPFSQVKPPVEMPKRASVTTLGSHAGTGGIASSLPENPQPNEIATAAIAQAQAGPAAPPAPGVKVISLAQAKRLFAIAKEAGKSQETIKAYLGTLGYSTSLEIPVERYDEIVECLGRKVDTATGEVVDAGTAIEP